MQLEPVNKLTAYTSVYLRGLCKEYGIPHTGGRTELIERLREFIEGELEREQNQSQSLVETTPTRSPVEPVPSVRSSTVEKNVEKTPGDDAQSRLARNRKRPIRKPPASFFTDPPIRLFAVAVEIPVRPKESSDYENLSNGADVETIESSDVEVPSDDEESQSEPELPAPETRQQQTAIRGRPIGGGRGSRGRGRGRGQSRGRNGQTSRGGRTTRSSTRELEAEQKDSDTEVETKVRTPTPIPESPVRTKDTVTKPVDDQAIPTPPKEEDDVEMEDTSLVESVEEDPQEAQPQNTHPNQTTTGDTIDIKQKETDTTFDGTETPAPSRIPATDYTRPPDPEEHLNDRQAAEPTNESKASEPSAETSVQIAEESVVSPAHEDVHMKDADAAQPVAVQVGPPATTPQEGLPVTGTVNSTNGYDTGYYDPSTAYPFNEHDYQATDEYYRPHGFNYIVPGQEEGRQKQLHETSGVDPQPQQPQEQQPVATAPIGPTDYTEVPAPTNLPAMHTDHAPAAASEQQLEIPDARKRKRGETPPLVAFTEDSGNKKPKQNEIAQPQPVEVDRLEQEAQVSNEQLSQPQQQSVPSLLEAAAEQNGNTEQINGSLAPLEQPRGKLSFSLGSRKAARPAFNDDESLADLEPEESSTPWNSSLGTNPPLHPPTRALYIDNLMRPLKEYALRDHLSSLAEPETYQSVLSRTPADPVENCYLDPLKSHAFASFQTVEQAIRVRAALHNKVWPDERNRKPLQIDYFPEQLFSEWVVKERQSSSEGRVLKWRVAYKSGPGPNGVRAVLEEMGESAYQPFNKDNYINENRYSNRRHSGGYNNYGYGNKYSKHNGHNRYYSQDSNSMKTSPNFIPTGPRKSSDGHNRRMGSIDYERPRKVYEEPVHIDDEKYYDDDFHGDEKDTSHVDDSKYYKSPHSSSRRKHKHRRHSSKEYSPKEYRDYSPPPRDRTRSPTPERSRERSLTKSRSPDRDRDRSVDSLRDDSRERSRTRSRSATRERTPKDRSRTRSLSRDRTPREPSRGRSRGRSRERSRDRDVDDRSRRHVSEAVVDGHSKHRGRDREVDLDVEDDHHDGERKRRKMNMDELFMFTRTKPKLYYLPVSEEVARERLKHREDMHRNARRYWKKKSKW